MGEKCVFILLTVLIGLCWSSPQGSIQLDDLISGIFNITESINPNPVIQPQPPVIQPQPPVVIQPTPRPDPRTQPSGPYRSCGLDKECVPRYLCRDDKIEEFGAGIIDIRINADVCNYLEVCCDLPNKLTKPPVIIPKHENEGCGYRNADGVGYKIVGDVDNESQFGEFPWMMAIVREEIAGDVIINAYECGGSLIAPTVVLTGAHCVQTRKPDELFARAGEWDTQTQDEIKPYQDRRVKDIIVHENFNKGTLFNDVALLILSEPFDLDEHIQPACLPEQTMNFDHSRCFATGWGKNKFGRDGEYQVILKKIELPVVEQNKCQSNLRSTRLGLYFKLHDSFICAGGEKDVDTCKGDGGSPLVCPIPGKKNRYFQAGMVAWGIGCGEENIPGVYVNVPYLRPWIDQKLRAKGIDFSYFTP